MTPLRLLALFRIVLVFGFIATHATNAAAPCTSDGNCQELYSDLVGRTTDGWERPVVSVCLPSGFCSNPFHGGCLRLFGVTDEQRRTLRVCNSDDVYFRAEQRNTSWANTNIDALYDCTARKNDLRYPELRVHHADWESSVFLSWIYQIFLSEVLGVPTTVGLRTGANTASASFYSLENEMPFSERQYPYWALVKANEMEDGNCSKVTEDCANVFPEVWAPVKDFQPYVANGTIESPIANGQVARTNYFIPDFTVKEYPSLAIHYGYQGEEKRRFLAETFKKPLTWREYCEEVSNSSCADADKTAKRLPDEDTIEPTMYFAEGDYTGYFKKTDQNDCDANPTTCTGYFSAPPCVWNIYPDAQFYWNGIVGFELVEYDAVSLAQIWRAAHATKSHVIVGWYQPELLVQEFFATDASFQEISFPPPTDVCVSHRVSEEQRCSSSLEERRGNETGACGNEIKQLRQLVTSSVRSSDQKPEPEKSPAFDFIKNTRISELDINRIFQQWLEVQNEGDKYGSNARTAVCRWVAEHYSELSMFVPPGHPRRLSKTSQYFAWYVSLAQVFGILTGLAAVVAMTLVFRYRDTKVMVFAQPLFLLFILLGFLFVCTGAALLAVEPTQEICISVMWFVLLGYSIELIPVLVKTAAINKLIQSSKKSKRVNIKRSRLILDVAVVTTMVLIFLVCWTVIDPPGRYENLRIKLDDPRVVELDLQCASEKDFWKIAAFVWEVLLLAMAALLAYQSRNVLKEFNESNTLGVMVYSHLLFLVIRGILQVLAYYGTLSFAFITSLMSFNYSLDALASMCIYVFPKLAEARKNPMSYLQSKLQKRVSRWTSDETAHEDALKLLVCTANIGNAEPTLESMESWIPLRGSCKVVTTLDNVRMRAGYFDIIAIGMQESTWHETGEAKQQKKEVSEEDILNAMEEHHTSTLREMLQDILGEGYSEVAEDQRGQMRLYIWASNAVVDKIDNVAISGANTGIGNVLANKGGIVITLTYQKTRISFLSAHLAAHEGEVYYKARCDNLRTIVKESKTFGLSSKLDASMASHHMFVMGDLNFRTKFDGDGKHDDNVHRAKQLIDSKDYAGLYAFDELQQGLEKGDMLVGFTTLPCNFPPTFKVQREEGFVYKDQRVPSYTDRVLFKSAMGMSGNLRPLAYEPCVDFVTSDHKPVRAAFSIVPNEVAATPINNVDIRLEFSHMECSDLPAADTNGLSDPYLLFLWDSIDLQPEKTSFKDKIRKFVNGTSWPRTSSIPRTLNPNWDSESLALFARNTKIESHAMLWILAMDADLLTLKDDFLGGVALNVFDIASMKTGETDKAVYIERDLQKGAVISGHIKFQIDVQVHSRKTGFTPLKMEDDIL